MVYSIVRFVINLFMSLISQVEVHGIENAPRSGGFVIVSNHLGRLDPPLAYVYINRKDIILMVAEKYQKYAFFRWLVRQLNALWVDRFNADFATLRKVLTRLRQGEVLALAPEGTRSPTGALIQGRPGASYLAAKAGVPIIPVAITGTEDRVVLAQLKRLRRARIVIRVGEAFTLPAVGGKDRDAQIQAYTDEIMCQIAALLPPVYRGVYSEHPRLQELLAAQPRCSG